MAPYTWFHKVQDPRRPKIPKLNWSDFVYTLYKAGIFTVAAKLKALALNSLILTFQIDLSAFWRLGRAALSVLSFKTGPYRLSTMLEHFFLSVKLQKHLVVNESSPELQSTSGDHDSLLIFG